MSLKFDFNKVIDRRGTNCTKWDSDPRKIEGIDYDVPDMSELLPMWIADMDFESAPEIVNALCDKARHGNFGYANTPESAYEAVIRWERQRHGWDIKREWICFVPGAVSAAHLAVQAVCQPGDSIIIQPPVYYPFWKTVLNNGCHLAYNPLELINTHYEMNLKGFEQQSANSRTSFFILCSPHNPVGRVWTRDELSKIGEICVRDDVVVFSDELHCDLIMPGHKHLPFAMVDKSFAEISITAIAPSKTFNLAGLQATVLIIPNRKIRRRFENVMLRNAIPRMNLFAAAALETAYTHGEEWLDEALIYIKDNYDFIVSELGKKLPDVKVMPLEGTYLAWLDFRKVEPDYKKLQRKMLCDAKLWLDEGWIFGHEGEGFERMTIACPRSIVEKAVRRLTEAFGS